jgi:Outer membrane protein beta-barrel family
MKTTSKIGIVILLIWSTAVNAQNSVIKGIIVDKISKDRIANSVIYILRAKDSMLLSFARSKSNGSFEIDNVLPNKVLILISHPNYAEYTDELIINTKDLINLDSIYLTNKAKLLEAIIVKGSAAAIRLKGDTTEYNVDSFYVPPNATVEDLLKKLPGIRVDKNGKITAQGERVTQILVDGEEFFSGDPTLATQNLAANMIDKVQVYDKKNDLGNTTKTINLKLKEDKKNGYFGKINYGQGTDSYYNNKIIYNSFKGKRKFAAYGIISNTGQSGLNAEEEETFEDASLANATDNLGILDNWSGYYDQKGLPALQSLGLHYNNKFSDDRQSINGNYKFQNLKLNRTDTSIAQINLPDTSYYVKEQLIAANKILRSKITGNYDVKIDSSSSIKLSVYGENAERESGYNFSTLSTALNNSIINSENRKQSVKGGINIFNSSLVWTKRFKKPRRGILATITENYKQDNAKGYLFSENLFYKYGNVDQSQITDQYKTNNYHKFNTDIKLAYTEPVSDDAFLVFNLGLTSVNSTSNANSFNRNSGGSYEVLDSLYSGNFKFKTNLLKGGLGYVITKSKYFIISNLTIGKTYFKQTDNYTLQKTSNSFINFLPNLLFTYKLTRQNRFTIKYDGRTINPSLQQIQQIKSNITPLNIVLGNSNLKPSFANDFRISYSAYKNKTERRFLFRLDYNNIRNDITSKSAVDSFGRNLYQYININGNRIFTETIEYDYKISKIDIYLAIITNIKQSRFTNIVNNKQNIIANNSKYFSLNFSKYVDKKYDASVEFGLNQTSSKSTLRGNEKINYLDYNITPGIKLYFPWKLELYSDCSFIFRKTNANFIAAVNNKVWNAWVEKNIFKNNDLQIRIAVNDILNNNIGYIIDANTNYIRQSGYNLIKRYGMLSIIWNFNKGKAAE